MSACTKCGESGKHSCGVCGQQFCAKHCSRVPPKFQWTCGDCYQKALGEAMGDGPGVVGTSPMVGAGKKQQKIINSEPVYNTTAARPSNHRILRRRRSEELEKAMNFATENLFLEGSEFDVEQIRSRAPSIAQTSRLRRATHNEEGDGLRKVKSSSPAGGSPHSPKEELLAIPAQEDEGEDDDEEFEEPVLRRSQLMVVLTLFMAESFSGVMLFPFVTYMVRDFGIAKSESQLGLYVGVLASSFSLFQFVSAFFWGRASDIWGRRPILLLGLFGNAICVILFGYSKTFTWALITRSINGLLNGNFAVIRVYLREITTQANQAQAFALLGLTWGLSSILGPMVGGFLAMPATKFKFVSEHGALGTYPYLLPCLVSGLISLGGLVAGFFYLTESKRVIKVIPPTENNSTRASLLKKDEGQDQEEAIQAPAKRLDESRSSFFETKTEASVWSVFFTRDVLLITSATCILRLSAGVHSEIFSVWATSGTGFGLGLTTTEIAYNFMAQGAVLVIWQLYVFRRLVASIGLVKLFTISLFVSAIANATVVYLDRIPKNSFGFWATLVISFAVRGACLASSYTSSTLLLNNCATRHIGAINGLASALASLFVSAGPLLGGAGLAWSYHNGLKDPFDHHFLFLLNGVITLIGTVLAAMLPNSAGVRRETAAASKE